MKPTFCESLSAFDQPKVILVQVSEFIRIQNQQEIYSNVDNSLKNLMRNPIRMKKLFSLLSLILIASSANITDTFCSSICAGSVGACFGPNENDCWACAQSSYLLQKNSSGVCQPKIQHQVLFYELKNSAMSLSGYSSSKPTPQTCDQYTMSGQYVAGDYLQKTLIGIPLNHYELVVRFSIGHIGTWNSTDQMHLKIDGVDHSWNYRACQQFQPLCSIAGTDCFKTQEFPISHNTANVSLRFTSSLATADPNIQYWGIKDLLIIAKTCHSRCDTCFGPGYADCASCANGFFLLGNLCVPECQRFASVETRMCLEQCPTGYFGSSTKVCQACAKDCLVCTDTNSCEVWSDDKEGVIWERNKFFWILIIIIGFLILLYVIYRIFIRKYLKVKGEENEDIKKSMITQSSIGNIEPENNKSSASSGSSGEGNQKKDRNAVTNEAKAGKKDVIVFEEQGLQWIKEDSNGGQNHSGVSIAKRKKKRSKPFPFDEPMSVDHQPQPFEMQGTIQNLNL